MTVNLSKIDRLILSVIACALVFLCIRGTAESAQAQKRLTPLPVKIVGKFELSVPTDGLPVDVRAPIEINTPLAGLPVRIVERPRP